MVKAGVVALFLLLSSLLAYAEEPAKVTCTGKVVDEAGKPVAGASSSMCRSSYLLVFLWSTSSGVQYSAMRRNNSSDSPLPAIDF